MDISLDTEVMKKIEKDLAYNLKYLQRIDVFLFKLGDDLDANLKGEGTEAMLGSINELRNLLSEKNYNLYGEFSKSLIQTIEKFEEIDQEIAKKIADAK